MKKKYIGYYNIVKNETKKEATIFIYGVIGGFDWETWTFINTSDSFLKEFSEVEKEADTIHVRINSPGGNVHDGLAIYNALNNSKKTIHTYNDGICYSMAALLLLAGDKVHSFDNCLFMTHNVISAVWGNAQEMRTEASVLDKYDEALGTAIENKLGISAQEVKDSYLNYNDNFFTAKEASKIGFYDEIIKKDSKKLPDNIKDLTPKNLLEHYAKMNFDVQENKTPATTKKNTVMKKFKMVLAVLGLEMLASTDEGSYLNEEQFEMLENEYARLNKEVADSSAALKAESDKLSEKEQQLKTYGDTLTVLAAKAGAEVGNDPMATFKNIEARIEELNQEPGATHTQTGAPAPTDGEDKYHYIDFDSPIYKN